MALRRGLVNVGAAVACCALTAACTSEPAPGATSSPTPVLTTPTESQIERQMRLDYEAAEKAYRAAVAEHERQAYGLRVVSAGKLKLTATDVYLDFSLSSLRRSHDSGLAAEADRTDSRRGSGMDGKIDLFAFSLAKTARAFGSPISEVEM